MGAKDSKRSCLSYEDAVKRSKWHSKLFVLLENNFSVPHHMIDRLGST